MADTSYRAYLESRRKAEDAACPKAGMPSLVRFPDYESWCVRQRLIEQGQQLARGGR
jgi:hypothetical protein